MSDKPKRRYGPSAFGELSDSPTAGDVADGIFGASRTTKSIRAKPTDIMKIKPDPVQPRRSVPSELRSAWAGNPHRMVDMFDMWTKRIREERGGSELKWKNILEGDDSLRGTEAETLKPDKDPLAALTELPETGISTLESNFLRLVDLAASIKRDGLTNPITVVKAGKDQFIIETGERRWLAYHLLKMVYGEKDWGDIPARHVDGLSVWRQASENNARSDLNAISKARQLALLLMALYAEEHEFEPLEHFEHEQEFYAQVADGQKWRVPRNHGEKLLNAMGLSTASHLRRYRAILRVDSSIWDEADDGDWTEREIRDKWQIAKARSKKRDRGHGDDTEQTPLPTDNFGETRKFWKKTLNEIALTGQQATVGELTNLQRLDTLEKIKSLREWLNNQEKLIKDK